MTFSAIIMMIIGLGITWGGAAICIKKSDGQGFILTT
ncbi:hypothetical protein DK128_15535 [Vibrio cholerae O1 biovar El Tor]|nr:hypothetical protein [Vibrio cholerae O1 biovar El Tor]